MKNTDREVVATLIKANRKDLARAYLLIKAKRDPAKTMQAALNDAKLTLDGLAMRDPGYKPLVKKLAALSAEIFKTLKERG